MEARDFEDELIARFIGPFVSKIPVRTGIAIGRDFDDAEFYGREYESMEDLE